MTRQLTQLTLRAVGDEAGPQQSMPEQVGDPLRILDVRLASGHRFDVPSVDHHGLQLRALNQVDQRLPVDAAALHGHVGHRLGLEPTHSI